MSAGGVRRVSGQPRPRLLHPLVRVFIVLDVALLVACAAWLLLRSEAPNVVNGGLHGSTPPAGQRLPELERLPGIAPRPPARGQLEGSAVALVATCVSCRSGDILGGFLGRLERDDVPDDARLLVVGWGGDVRAWSERWGVGSGPEAPDVEVYGVRGTEGVAAARSMFRIGPGADGGEESGIVFVHDRRLVWRSSFSIGQLDRDDLRHDLQQLSRD